MIRFLARSFLSILLIGGWCAGVNAQTERISSLLEEPAMHIVRGHDNPVLAAQERGVQELLRSHPEVSAAMRMQKTAAWPFNPGSTYSWYADDLTGGSARYLVPSTCRAKGTNCYLFVEDASWNAGKVTQAVVDSFVAEFDARTPANPGLGIYQMDTDAFGNPPNVDADPRVIILILDIKDGYTPGTGWIAGYFTSFNEVPKTTQGYATSNQAEMFYMDCDPTPLSTPSGLNVSLATLAHEFQHMIHFNYDPQEITFINESCSLVAEVHCGFPIYSQSGYAGETNTYLFGWRTGDLANVGKDYSRAARFSYYLWDQFGIGVFKPIVASTLPGIFGIDAGLQAWGGTTRRFNDIFVDWTIANMLNDRSVNTRWGYANTGLAKPVGMTFAVPNVPLTNGTAQNLGVEYLSFTGGSNLTATFTGTNPSLMFKAIETGPGGKRVLDLTSGVAFNEPGFGTTYSAIRFAVINTGTSVPFGYSYQVSGGGGTSVVEIRYDQGEPSGVIAQSTGDTAAVQFDAVAGGRLDSIRVAVRRGVPMTGGVWRYTGVLRPTPLGTPLAVPITASTGFTPGTPYPVPWNNWATINVRSSNIDVSTPFVVGFRYSGEYPTDPNTNRIMAVPIPGSTFFHTCTWLNAPSGGGPPAWYYLSRGADTIWAFMIRAYVSFGPADARQTVELLPASFALGQNYPNPFNPSTKVQFTIVNRQSTIVKVYDVLGKEVATLVNEVKEPGTYTVQFDASNLAGGVYFYRLQAGDFVATKKLLLLR